MEALEQIKGIAPGTPVILFTAHQVDCMPDHRALLATACVAKADDLAELKQIASHTLDRENSEGESLRSPSLW
jgi:DNA-binding NtrC family response regulator